MTAFLISVVDILDPDRFAAYGAGLAGVTERAGGRYVLRGWCREVLEGDAASGSRVVIVAYDDPSGIERYAQDPAIIAAKPLKTGALTMSQTVVAQSIVPAPNEERDGTFLVISAKVSDTNAYKAYAAASKSAAVSHGGDYLVLGPVERRIDGEPMASGDHRAIVIQFPDADAARSYRSDPVYRDARAALNKGAELVVRLVTS